MKLTHIEKDMLRKGLMRTEKPQSPPLVSPMRASILLGQWRERVGSEMAERILLDIMQSYDRALEELAERRQSEDRVGKVVPFVKVNL